MNIFKNMFKAVASMLNARAGGIMDAKLEFSDAQTITATGYLPHSKSTNDIYLLDATAGAGWGRGTPIYLVVRVNTAFQGNTSSTIVVYLQTSTDGTTWSSGIAFASRTSSQCATVGAVIVAVPLPSHDLTKYISLDYYFPTGMSAGAVDAYLSLEAQTMPLDTTQYGWNG